MGGTFLVFFKFRDGIFPIPIASRKECVLCSGGARVLTQGGHDNFFGGAIFILDSGAEPAKWATEARSPSIGLSE